MIMDYCTGENLASRLPYSETNAVKLVCNILSAVKAVHNSGLLHQSSKHREEARDTTIKA